MDLRQTCPMDVKAQATVDSELVMWREWADNDERRELLPCTSSGTCGTGEQASPASPTRGTSNQRRLWACDTSGMVDARGGKQGGNR